MASEELILEINENNKYAPSINASEVNAIDEELAKDFQRIPDKMAFKIGEVATIVGVKAYVLRYWETEFNILKPQKSKHNQRVYTRKDVETVFTIKKLLYKDRFSIEGARSALRGMKKSIKKVSTITNAVEHFELVRDELHELIGSIKLLQKMLK